MTANTDTLTSPSETAGREITSPPEVQPPSTSRRTGFAWIAVALAGIAAAGRPSPPSPAATTATSRPRASTRRPSSTSGKPTSRAKPGPTAGSWPPAMTRLPGPTRSSCRAAGTCPRSDHCESRAVSAHSPSADSPCDFGRSHLDIPAVGYAALQLRHGAGLEEVLMNGRRMRVVAAAIVLTASAALMAGAGPAGATSSAVSSRHFRPRSDHKQTTKWWSLMVTGGHQRSVRTGTLTSGNPGIPGFLRSSRVPSHGRGHWFETSIAHQRFP